MEQDNRRQGRMSEQALLQMLVGFTKKKLDEGWTIEQIAEDRHLPVEEIREYAEIVRKADENRNR